MIVQWFLDLAAAVIGGALSALPVLHPPGWLTSADSAMTDFLTIVSDMGAWMPVGLMVSVFVAVLACIGIGFGIKVARIALSFLTAGGGSAG